MKHFELIRSGLVRRWHANADLAHSGETNGHHQWVVASIILSMHPSPSLVLLSEALWHDVGELIAGDLPAPFKDANPEMATAHAMFELGCRTEICGPGKISDLDSKWLSFADRLAAYLWMLTNAPHCRFRRDWIGACDYLIDLSVVLGVSDVASKLIEDFKEANT